MSAAVWGMAVWTGAVLNGGGGRVEAQRPSTAEHVPELARYLDHVEIAEPLVFRQLAVYPLLLSSKIELGGDWLTMDEAVARGLLLVNEKGTGSVPLVIVENRSRDKHIFIMTGELLAGGKQARTVREDVVLAPGQRIELDVFCVEAHRWSGGQHFSAAGALVPQSIQMELRRGADQQRVWSEVARNNTALGAENATGSLELALKSEPIRERLAEVSRSIVPAVPEGTMGFIFACRRRTVGGELFGHRHLARQLLPKLLDSYAVDCVLLGTGAARADQRIADQVAIEFFRRICRTGSSRTDTPGSGAGIRTRSGGLLGDGVSLAGTLVHYGVQVGNRIVPHPVPGGEIPRPRRYELPGPMQP